MSKLSKPQAVASSWCVAFVARWVPLNPPVNHHFPTQIAISGAHPISDTPVRNVGHALRYMSGLGQLQLLVSPLHLSHPFAR